MAKPWLTEKWWKTRGIRRKCTPEKLRYAKKLRREMTPSEKILWGRLRRKQLGVKFRRQAIILGWIVDFWCPSHKLAVEVDGLVHQSQREKDMDRDRKLLALRGIRTLRLPSSLVLGNADEAIERVKRSLKSMLQT